MRASLVSIALLSVAGLPVLPATAGNPPVVVQYHMWFDTGYGVESSAWPTTDRSDARTGDYVWAGWDLREWTGNPSDPSPRTVRNDAWRRKAATTKDYYPLVGLYDPDDSEILRWHIRLAKAAGIDALACSLYVWWDSPAEHRLAEIFRKMLDVAQEENFRLAWEVWWGGHDMPQFFARYRDIVHDPAYYRVNGKPLIWIAPAAPPLDFFGRTVPEFDAMLTRLEGELGTPVTWAVNGGTQLDYGQSKKSVILMTSSNLFWPSDQAWATAVAADVRQRHNAGKRIGTHVYPGFDEASIRREKRYHPRKGGESWRFALQTSANVAADYVFVESWNDFGEATAIEPGYKEDFYDEPHRRDPYKDLRILAMVRGRSFAPPPLPPGGSIDPLARERLYRKVTFRGKAGLGSGAVGSNGVIFSLFGLYSEKWVTLASRLVRHGDGVASIVQDVSEVYGPHQALILGADANGDSSSDWAHWVEAGLEVGGERVFDFVAAAPSANWHSKKGAIPWGTSSADGTAMHAYRVLMSDGREYARTLYVHPDFSFSGFSHGGFDANVTTTRPVVVFRGRAGLAQGAVGTNGVLFSLMAWNGSRWVTLASRLARNADGMPEFSSDVSGYYGRNRTFVLGADANGDASYDWAHWVYAVLEVNGTPVYDFVQRAPQASWHSTKGPFSWGTTGANGTATYVYGGTMGDGRAYPRTLFVHPDFSPFGFSHGGYAGVDVLRR